MQTSRGKKLLKKLTLLVELRYDSEIMHGDSQPDMDWFYGEILKGNHLMLIDSGDLGDEIGEIKVLEIAPKQKVDTKGASDDQ